MPKIVFSNLSNKIQKRFFNLCHPVLLHDLATTSKSHRHICPTTYRSNYTLVTSTNYRTDSVFDRKVLIDVRGELHLDRLGRFAVPTVLKNMRLNHDKLFINNCYLFECVLERLLTPNVKLLRTRSRLWCDLKFLIQHLPNVENLDVVIAGHSEFERLLNRWKQNSKLKSFNLRFKTKQQISNPKALCDFMNRQDKDFSLAISGIEIISSDFSKYFEVLSKKGSGRSLALSFSDKLPHDTVYYQPKIFEKNPDIVLKNKYSYLMERDE